VFHDITEKKRAQEQILSYQKQLKKLASSISREAEKERHRIATTLHAGIGQLLAVSKLKLDLLEKEAGEDERIRGAVGNIRELLEQAIDESHRINFELFPPALHHLGLEPALKVLAENKSKQLGIPIRFSDDGNPKPIDEEVRDLLFQSVRELIQNAVKHADPSSMRLSVERRNESCVVRVEDDGAGFDPALLKDRRGKGFGLFSMELDVQHIGGSMKIESSPGKGTRTTLCMPLTRAAE
jgi:signal transduction histidine kinase